MKPRWAAILGVLVLGACATTAPSAQRSLLLVPAYASSDASGAPAPNFVAAAAKALKASGRYGLRERGWFESGFDEAVARIDYPRTAVLDDGQRAAAGRALHVAAFGLTDVTADGPERLWRVHFRIVDAATGSVLEAYSLELPWGASPQAAASVLATPSAPPAPEPEPRLDPSDAWEAWWALAPALTGEALVWRALLDRARDAGDFEEALRLADLIAAQAPFAGARGSWLRAALVREATRAREDRDFKTLMLALLPGATEVPETLAAERFVDLVLQTEATSSAARRPEVAAAFRNRFGVELAVALTRPPTILVEGGSFLMGSDQGESDERPVHQVTVTRFLMGTTAVTQGQYKAVQGFNPSLFTRGADAPRRPVERVTWFDAVEFCIRLSRQQGLEPVYTLTKRRPAKGYPIVSAEVSEDASKDGYRLPTEAEREWAARGGALGRGTALSGGNDPALVAWTDGNDGPHPVGTKLANELGLFDLSGNVWEWCADWYGKYPPGAQTNPRGPELGILKVGRGGSWHAAAWNARTTARSYDNPGARGGNIGFRVVRTLTPATGN